MTTIQSGFFQTPSNTPTGQPYQVAVDNPYITVDDYLNSFEAQGLGLSTSSPQYASGELQKKIIQASGMVNRITRKHFDTQTIDEQMRGIIVRPYNPQLVTNVLNNRPYRKINSIYIQVLKWFIQVDTSPDNGYLQDFPDKGFYKIVPLLSSAGTGVGSPIPAAILDRVALGVLWTNYTFGYGTDLTSQSLVQPQTTTDLKTYQVALGYRLWAKTESVKVYKNSVEVSPTLYSVDYINGIVVFNSANLITDVITADFTTNQSIPFDIQEATQLLTTYLIGQAQQNPLGSTGYSIQTYSINFGSGKNPLLKRAEEILEPWTSKIPKII